MAKEIERKQPQQGEVRDPEVDERGQGDDLRGIAEDDEGEFEETEDLDEEEEDESIK